MRIGVVTTSFPRWPDDPAGSFVAKTCQWIASQGHELEVVAASAGNDDDSWQEMPVFRVPAPYGLFYEGGAPDALNTARRYMDALLFSARLMREVRKRSQDWQGLAAHWLLPSALASVLATKNQPVWATAHGGDVHLLARLGLTKVVARLFNQERVHLNFVASDLQNLFAHKAGSVGDALLQRSTVASMGIDLPHFQSLRAPERAAQNRNAKQDKAKPLVLFLGRLVPIKGVDTLLRALKGLDRDCQVVVAGAGPMQTSLKELAATLGLALEWAGEVHGEERDALLAAAKVVVIPSRESQGRREGMPLVAMEALASGAQLIASKSGGLGEIPATICHPVAPDDPSALRKILRRVLDGETAPKSPGSWLASRSWDRLAPAIFPGLSRTHDLCRTA